MMSEKIFILCQDDLGNYEIRYDDKIFHFLWEAAPILNEQQATISKLEEENEQLKQKLELLGLNEKNDMVKMVDGKFFIRM